MQKTKEIHTKAPKRFWILRLPNRMKLSLKTGKVAEHL